MQFYFPRRSQTCSTPGTKPRDKILWDLWGTAGIWEPALPQESELSLLSWSGWLQRVLGNWIYNKNELRGLCGHALSWCEHVLPQQALNIRDVGQELLWGSMDTPHRREVWGRFCTSSCSQGPLTALLKDKSEGQEQAMKVPSACARLGHWGSSWAVLGRSEQSRVPPEPCPAGPERGHWGKGRG